MNNKYQDEKYTETDPTFRVKHFHNVLSPELLDEARQYLFKDVAWKSAEETKVFVGGQYVDIPRRQTAYSTIDGLSYNFSSAQIHAEPEDSLPILKRIREAIQEFILKQCPVDYHEFNFMFLNSYMDGNHYIGWHSDDEKDLVNGSMIASLSFGQARDFVFRKRCDNKDKRKYVLRDNELLLMLDPTNKHWQHTLPKRSTRKCPNERINITFRLFK